MHGEFLASDEGGPAPWAYFDIFSTKDQQAAAGAQIAGINQGIGDLSSSFGQGRGALSQNYTAGLQPFLQNYAQDQQGTKALGDALGLNGASGNAAATAAFQNNPGYDFALQQGNNSILANQAATGQLASGATNLDLLKFGQGTANQGWQQYVQNLQPYLGAANSAASGIGGLYSGLGNQLNSNFMNLGNAQYGADTSIGNANANSDLAGLGASANGLGAIAGGLGLGANLYGSFMKSDARAKEEIEPVGELYDGQHVYRYRYRGEPHHQIGLIAQEVEERHPDAVAEFGGVKHVNYERATRPAVGYAKELLKFAA